MIHDIEIITKYVEAIQAERKGSGFTEGICFDFVKEVAVRYVDFLLNEEDVVQWIYKSV